MKLREQSYQVGTYHSMQVSNPLQYPLLLLLSTWQEKFGVKFNYCTHKLIIRRCQGMCTRSRFLLLRSSLGKNWVTGCLCSFTNYSQSGLKPLWIWVFTLKFKELHVVEKHVKHYLKGISFITCSSNAFHMHFICIIMTFWCKISVEAVWGLCLDSTIWRAQVLSDMPPVFLLLK